MPTTLTEPRRHQPHVKLVGAFGGITAFTIEAYGHLGNTDAVATEGVDPGQELQRRRQLCRPVNRADHAMLAGHVTRPMPRHVHLFAVILYINTDAIQQHAHDLLPLLRRHLRRMPPSGDICSSAQDRLGLLGGQLRGTLTPAPRLPFWLVWLMTQGLPVLLPFARHQTVFRCNGAQLSGRPLEALLPMRFELCALGSSGVFGGETQLYSGFQLDVVQASTMGHPASCVFRPHHA